MIKFSCKVFITMLSLACLLAGVSTSARADDAFAKIKKSGVLKVAVYNDFAPFSAGGNGIDIDLADALAKKLGLAVSLLPFPAGDDLGDDLRNMVWKGHYLGYGPADVLLHVPVDPNLRARTNRWRFSRRIIARRFVLLLTCARCRSSRVSTRWPARTSVWKRSRSVQS